MRERPGHGVRAWRVSGRVQGVGFRWQTTATARELGLEGRVWNRDDGGVEVHASGPAHALDALEVWLGRGPPAARVERVTEVPAGPEAAGPGFHAVVRP